MIIPMPCKISRLLVLVAVGLFPALADAWSTRTEHPALTDTFTASAGAFVLDRDFKLSVEGSADLDLNRSLDFDESAQLSGSDSSAALELRWRFGEKWSLWGQYFSTKDDGRAELTRDVEWEDVVFGKGTFVGAGLEVKVARLMVGRIFSSGPRHEFGAGVGLHWFDLGAYIEGEAFIDDENTGFYRGDADAAAPLPNIGSWYTYAFNPRWALLTRVDWFGASFGDYSGSFWNASAGINYSPFEHFGASLTYNYINLDVDVDKSDWRGSVDVTFSGPFLSLTTYW